MNDELEWIKDVPDYFSFENLVFRQHPLQKDVKIPLLWASGEFPNGKTYSVIFGELFYSNGIDTYEIMTSEDDEPYGYCTVEEINEILKELQK